jgi:hypothetical protein
MVDRPHRPGTVLGAGIMLFIFGGYELVSGISSTVAAALILAGVIAAGPAGAAGPQQPADLGDAFLAPFRDLAREIQAEPILGPLLLGQGVLTILIAVAAIAAAIGVLKLYRTGRKLGMAVAIANLLMGVLGVMLQIVFVMTVTRKLDDQQ